MSNRPTNIIKTTLTMIGILLLSATSYAQISLSVGGGLNVAKITNSDGDLRFGYQLGGYADYALNSTFSLQTGLVLNNKGTDNFDNRPNATVNALYIDVPLMGTYHLKIRDNAIFTISAGPYMAYGMAGTTRIEEPFAIDGTNPVEYEGRLVEYRTFSSNALKRWDFGVGIDAGIQHNSIWLGVRNQYGLLNISNIENRAVHNQSFAVTFAYRFYQK